MRELRVVIADDSSMIREELQRILSTITGIVVAGVATDGAHAFWLAQVLKPDVLILDMSMPKVSGLQVLQEIRKRDSVMKIVIFSSDAALILQAACLKAGADFYLNKSQLGKLLTICQELRGD